MRTKASSENIALTASLRKEQMKNESLEQALQQKVRGNFMFLHANCQFQNVHLAMTCDTTYLSSFYIVFLCSDLVYRDVLNVLIHYFLCCHRIRRLRNSLRSVMS